MTARHVLVVLLGTAAIAIAWASAIGVWRSPHTFARVHFAGPVGTVAAVAVLAAVALGDGDVWFKLKVALAMVLTLALTPVVAHALARAEYDRGEDAP